MSENQSPAAKPAAKPVPAPLISPVMEKRLKHNLFKNKLETVQAQHAGLGAYKKIIILSVMVLFVLALLLDQGRRMRASIELDEKYKAAAVKVFNPQGTLAVLPARSQLPADLKPVEGAWLVGVPEQADLPACIQAVQEQQRCALTYGLPVEVVNDLGIVMRLVPPGEYRMGSSPDEQGRGEAEDQHLVRIEQPFYIAKYELTMGQLQAVMGPWPTLADRPLTDADPARDLSFNDSLRYCQKLNERYGLPAHSYTLPSEEQWEYACRAGSQTPWFFGDDTLLFPYYMNALTGSNYEAASPRLRPNAWGLFQLAGSMQEFTSSHYGLYECAADQFSGRFDRAIYDGDVPEDIRRPFDNFKVPLRGQGCQVGLYFHDADGDGFLRKGDPLPPALRSKPAEGLDPLVMKEMLRQSEEKNANRLQGDGEFIWADVVEPGVFNYGKDIVIYRCDGNPDRDFSVHDGVRGSQAGLFYHDANGNFRWDAGEGLWERSDYLRKFSGHYAVRDGAWAWREASDCRSAGRWVHSNENKGAYLGVRLVRRLSGILPLSPLPGEVQP